MQILILEGIWHVWLTFNKYFHNIFLFHKKLNKKKMHTFKSFYIVTTNYEKTIFAILIQIVNLHINYSLYFLNIKIPFNAQF